VNAEVKIYRSSISSDCRLTRWRGGHCVQSPRWNSRIRT